jgi:hypothetical protein
MKKIINIIAPGNLKSVTNIIVQMFRGILIFMNDPIIFTVNIIIRAINNDLKNHLIKFFICSTPYNNMGQYLSIYLLFNILL